MTLQGNPSKPVLLFLHGGPGSPLSPYADQMYGAWAKDFLLVQWDQRGSGKTFGRIAPSEISPEFLKANPLTLEQMTSDGIALAEYLIQRLGKTKVILLGTSWGSVLGMEMALKRPDLFHAYVGHSQVVNASQNFTAAYQKVLQLAQQADDQPSLTLLRSLGAPPYTAAKSYGQMLRVVKKYERERSLPAPSAWMVLSPEYDKEPENQHRADGDDYSFVHFTGDERLGVPAMASGINYLRDGFELKVPAFYLQGEEDILTPPELTTAFFQKLKAPQKSLVLLPQTAHGFNQQVLDAQLKILQEKVLPLLQ